MNAFRLRVLSADAPFYDGLCESLIVPTSEGKYGIQAGHSNLVAAIVPGIVSYRPPEGETAYLSVSEGIVKVENNDVQLLVDTAETPDQIDVAAAEREAARAREALQLHRADNLSRMVEAKLARELIRMKAKGYQKK